MVTRIAPEELEVEPVGFGPEIGLLTGVPALGDVVKNPGENHVRFTSRGRPPSASRPMPFSR
jgi:hypothetical protein